MLGKCSSQRLVNVFPNVWQMFFPTFGKCIFQRLANVFSNVWQMYFPTFDKNIFKVKKSVDK